MYSSAYAPDNRRRSLIPEDMNLSLNRFIWHDYPEMLERLGFHYKTAGLMQADMFENVRWWKP